MVEFTPDMRTVSLDLHDLNQSLLFDCTFAAMMVVKDVIMKDQNVPSFKKTESILATTTAYVEILMQMIEFLPPKLKVHHRAKIEHVFEVDKQMKQLASDILGLDLVKLVDEMVAANIPPSGPNVVPFRKPPQ